MQKPDAKFYGQIRKVKDDTVVPEEEYMVFLLQDNAFAATLPVYVAVCRSLGADQEHIDCAERMLSRLKKWREENPGRCKVPDAKGERLRS